MIMEDYKPRRKEVLSEIVKEGGRKVSSAISKKNVKEFGIFFLGTGGFISIMPYAIPTAIRELADLKKRNSNFSRAESSGGSLGIPVGLISLIGQLVGASYLVGENYDHSEV